MWSVFDFGFVCVLPLLSHYPVLPRWVRGITLLRYRQQSINSISVRIRKGYSNTVHDSADSRDWGSRNRGSIFFFADFQKSKLCNIAQLPLAR